MTDPRNITKFNPIPSLQCRQAEDESTLFNTAGTETVRGLFTVLGESVIAIISAATGGAVATQTKPIQEYPVVIYQHGLGQSNNNELLIASALTMAGYASAAIDHPLHGDKIITIGEGIYDSGDFSQLQAC
jgi:hypothetical protein